MRKYMYIGDELERAYLLEYNDFSSLGGVYYGKDSDVFENSIDLYRNGEYYFSSHKSSLIAAVEDTELVRYMYPNAIKHFGSLFILDGRC